MDSTKQTEKHDFEKQVIETYGKLNPTKEEVLDVWEAIVKGVKNA